MGDRTELDALKASVRVTEVARALGMELVERAGRTWARCPFHGKDTDPSLELDDEKGLWCCFGCPEDLAGGDIFRLVLRVNGGGRFREAVAFVKRVAKAGAGGVNGAARAAVATSTTSPALAAAAIDLDEGVEADASAGVRAARILARACELYRKNLARSAAARRYLAQRGVHEAALVARLGLGFSDGSLPQKVPEAMRAELAELGLLNARATEPFYQCVTIPLRHPVRHDEIVSLHGRSITARRHHFLRGRRRGLLNPQAFATEETVVLVEGAFDALALVRHGLAAVPILGTQGFGDDHRRAIERGRTELVMLCLDNDAAGRAATTSLVREVEDLGKQALVVALPDGVKDPSDFFAGGRGKADFEALLAAARPLAELGRVVVGPGAPAPAPATAPSEIRRAAASAPVSSSLLPAVPAAGEAPAKRNGATSSSASPSSVSPSSASPSSAPASSAPSSSSSVSPTSAAATPPAGAPPAARERPPELREHDEKQIVAEIGGLRFRVRGRARGSAELGSLKVTLRVERVADTNGTGGGEGAGGEDSAGGPRPGHLDELNLCLARARRRFAREAAEELGTGVQCKALERALVRLVDVIAWASEAGAGEAATASAAESKREEMSAERRAGAEELLTDPRLLERVVTDLERVGYVGEAVNKQITFLVAVSRLLDKPLAVIFTSASSAGKSRLAELVAELCPPEEVEVFSRITPAALYYMEGGVRHKLLVIDERDGSEAADYSIRSLQTRGKLSAAVTLKDPRTGRLATVTVEVEGPAAYIESMARSDPNHENATRCYVLTLDESAEQTARVQAAQRRAAAGGALAPAVRAALVERWRDAQRLLERLPVIVPYAPLLTFPTERVNARRDHERLLSLIMASALLHQRQREKRETAAGRVVVASVEDYRIAYELSREAVAAAQSDATRPATLLFEVAWEKTGEIAAKDGLERQEVSFTRRQLQEWARRPAATVWRHVRELVALELFEVASGRKGRTMRYRISAEAAPPAVAAGEGGEMLTPEQLEARIAGAGGSASPGEGDSAGEAGAEGAANDVQPSH